MCAFYDKTIPLAPNAIIRNMALGWLNAWTYDYNDPLNYTRDTCLAIRNNSDQLLGEYLTQLRNTLSNMRKMLPQPTRDKPFPPQDLLDEIKFMEQYIRQVEDIRTRIIGAPIPPQEITRHQKDTNLGLLLELQALDKKMFDLLSTMTDSILSDVKHLLNRRDILLRNFIFSLR